MIKPATGRGQQTETGSSTQHSTVHDAPKVVSRQGVVYSAVADWSGASALMDLQSRSATSAAATPLGNCHILVHTSEPCHVPAALHVKTELVAIAS